MECISEVPLDQPPIDLLRLFPGWRRRIETEYRGSETFRTLCDDWRICADAHARWDSSEAPVAARRRGEYSEWLAELEQEIEEWLKYNTAAGPEDAPARPAGEPPEG